jgi:hypothetical protein
MAKRLLPFRQYNEHDVVNMFALETGSVNNSITDVGNGDNGVFVKIKQGNLDNEPVSYAQNSYLGKTDYPFVGFNQYPIVNLQVSPASGTDRPLGLTLWETAQYDENGEKLLYYPQKAHENQVLLPGQSVPIATRGIFTVTDKAFNDSANFVVGNPFTLSTQAGKISGQAANYVPTGLSDRPVLGTIMAIGSRSTVISNTPDAYAGKYAIIKLSL